MKLGVLRIAACKKRYPSLAATRPNSMVFHCMRLFASVPPEPRLSDRRDVRGASVVVLSSFAVVEVSP